MGATVNGLLQNLWSALAFGAAAGLTVIFLWSYWQNRRRENGKCDDEELRATYERRQFRLYCADAKVIADLAIQRHLTDASFLRHLRTNPCFDALSPFFSEQFRDLLTQEPSNEPIKSFLIAAFQQEVKRLERVVDPLNPPPIRPLDLRESPAPVGRVVMASQSHTEDSLPAKLHHQEAEEF